MKQLTCMWCVGQWVAEINWTMVFYTLPNTTTVRTVSLNGVCTVSGECMLPRSRLNRLWVRQKSARTVSTRWYRSFLFWPSIASLLCTIQTARAVQSWCLSRTPRTRQFHCTLCRPIYCRLRMWWEQLTWSCGWGLVLRCVADCLLKLFYKNWLVIIDNHFIPLYFLNIILFL